MKMGTFALFILILCLSQADSDTFRFFDRKEYYSTHDTDALFAAEHFYKTMTCVKYWEPGNCPCVYVSKANFESFCRQLLLERRQKVEVWALERGKLSLTRRGSPGNLGSFEDILFEGNNEMCDSANVVAVKLTSESDRWVVGVAFADATALRLGVCEFEDNEQLTNLESALVRLGPKEVLASFEAGTAQGKKLREVLERCEVAITERKKADFVTKDVEMDLGRLLPEEGAGNISQFSMQHAMSAMSCVIKYLDLLRDDSTLHRFSITTIDLEKFMKIDGAAMRALNLFPAVGDTNKNMSLFGLLNKCKTAIGSRLLSQWIKQPLLDMEEINTRLSIVETFLNDTVLRESLMVPIPRSERHSHFSSF